MLSLDGIRHIIAFAAVEAKKGSGKISIYAGRTGWEAKRSRRAKEAKSFLPLLPFLTFLLPIARFTKPLVKLLARIEKFQKLGLYYCRSTI